MMTQQESQEIWNLIKDIKVAMLTSNDDGTLRARPMHHIQDEFDGTLWFYTAKSSGKVEELQKQNQVCLSYADPGIDTYVSLSGDVGFTQDKALIDKFWNSFSAAWFEGGKDDPDITLMEIRITQAESWDSKSKEVVPGVRTVC
ncbi:MAG: pyridoxamine 5'-phosphate oxidase family protein [Alphaproteobacteria bacterium]